MNDTHFSADLATGLILLNFNGRLSIWKQLALQQADWDEPAQVVLALSGPTFAESLHCFEVDGRERWRVAAPPNFEFQYLLAPAGEAIRLVCSGTSSAGDTLDWYFKVDKQTGTLTRQGRSY
ncbi:hypothetical protein FNU76_04895 [Chitinimonas arctica]|uniref:Uncharacterized protein n=1 Tax=Chitinimonas arctica TaxID=2594795 RepID=A0A516SCF8_9NEIS|nr:hypothetical protein [Chitinimonas arctica]QDQ25738.1 hypothetical protein FNU76_04895 [Chitinimonas arctica]